jgi:5-methylcytosine-specific restriction enzyme subunit McrC
MSMPTTESFTTFSLSEYEEQIVEVLDPEIAQKIQRTGIVELSRKVSGEFVIKADSKIGFISVQGVQVNVAPRFPIYNIFYFLGLIEEIKLDKEKVQIAESEDFLTVLFQSFNESVALATRKGLISGYVNREDSLHVLKGRINFSRQFKRNPGGYVPFEVSFDDFVEDIAENQIIKKALHIALKHGLQNRNLRNQAQNLLFNFKDVSDIDQIPNWNQSRLNLHYWNALRLAELIVSGNGFHENVGDIEISGFSIDMYKVFEDFVAKQLADRINGSEDIVATQKSLSLDVGGIYQEKPDLIWYREGKPFQVMDTKYKQPEGETQQRDSLNDLRQVISYASLLGLKEAHLIYGVAGNARSIETRQEGITVYSHGLDLGKTPLEIEDQLDSLVISLNARVNEFR